MKQVRGRAPSAAVVLALLALVVAASGSAVAASGLANGDTVIAKHSLSGNRLRNRTVTGKQINLSKLGKVPTASHADSATNAGHASTADSATNASHASTADSATNASHASTADNATNAANATKATTAGNGATTINYQSPSPPAGGFDTLVSIGPLTLKEVCGEELSTVAMTFYVSSSVAGDVNWTFATALDTGTASVFVKGGTLGAGGTVTIDQNGSGSLVATSLGAHVDRAEGQIVYRGGSQVITIAFNATANGSGSGSCEVTGTALPGS